MEKGRIKRALSKLNEALGFESPEPVGLTITKEIDPYLSVLEKTKAAIESNPKPDKTDWLTTAEAAALAQTTAKCIVGHIYNGHVKAHKTTSNGGMCRWYITRESMVKAYGIKYLNRGPNSRRRPKFYRSTNAEDIPEHVGSGNLIPGYRKKGKTASHYISKNMVIDELRKRVSALTLEVEEKSGEVCDPFELVQKIDDQDREIAHLSNRVSELTSHNDDLCERNRTLIDDTYHKINKDI